MHTHINGSSFTPVDYYCISTTLNYIYSLVSCRVATCFLFFSWWQAAWPKGAIAAESVSGRDWSLATHSLCGHEQFPASPYLSFPTDKSRKCCYPQGNCKHFIRASSTFALEHLVETWWLQKLCVTATASRETPFSAPGDCEIELQRTLVQVLHVPAALCSHQGPVSTGIFAGQTQRL